MTNDREISKSILLYSPNCDKKPILSVLIPTCGRSDGLRRAIKSVFGQTQTNFSFEVIIVSNDDIHDEEAMIRLQNIWDEFGEENKLYIYCNETNIGMVGNSNRCVELCHADYFAFLHDDDYLCDNYFETVQRLFFENEERGVCFITGRFNSYSTKHSGTKSRQMMKERILSGAEWFRPKVFVKEIKVKDNMYAGRNCYLSPSCGTIVLKKAFIDVGGFNPEIAYSWDFDFFLKLNAAMKVELCFVPIAVYTVADNASQKDVVKREFFEYYQTKLLPLYRKLDSNGHFLKLFDNCILYDLFIHLYEKNERSSSGLVVSQPSIIRFLLYKLLTFMYYTVKRLNIQRTER